MFDIPSFNLCARPWSTNVPAPPAKSSQRPAGCMDREERMDDVTRGLREVDQDDINPRFNWGRHLPPLGMMGVDFEELVDFQRLHKYRIGRVRQALDNSELGALITFDVNNIRYITSTKIGEWERDKLSRWALLTRGGEPILWDFGSAAVHLKLFCPWLDPENTRAGLVGLHGPRDPDLALM